MSSSHSLEEDLKNYRYTTTKAGGFSNPIAEYIWTNSQREPDVLRRLHEVCLKHLLSYL